MHIRFGLEEEANDVGVPLFCGLLQSTSLTAAIGREAMHIGIVLKEGLANFHVTFTCCDGKWRPSLVATIIRICVMLEEGLANCIVAFSRRYQERCRSVLAQGIYIGLHTQKDLTDLGVPQVAGLVERGVAVGAFRIQNAPLLDEELEDGHGAAVGCLLEQGRSFRVPLLRIHPLGEQNPHALGITSFTKLEEISEDEVQVLDERLLQGVELQLIQAPHVKLRGLAEFRPCRG
mmetsp:Transcript_125927/g.298945  ORF Transcript_125927/g.298945 Transcript_125927/m.298945 type:complete len:233 (+) Transcript_125927:277-975(+)